MRLHALSAIFLLLILSPAARGTVAPILLGGAYVFFWLEKREAPSHALASAIIASSQGTRTHT